MNTTPDSGHVEDLAERIKRRLEVRDRSAANVPGLRLAYRQAAALLSRFDPTLLRLPDGSKPGGAVLNLVDDCLSVGAASSPTWQLKPHIRQAALRSFDNPQAALQALVANVDAFESGPERAALQYLKGAPVDLSGMTVSELASTLQAVLWLKAVPGISGIPDADKIRERLNRQRLFQTFDVLLQGPFCGRHRELDQLRSYVGVIPSKTLRGKIKAAGRSFSSTVLRSARPKPPLVVHGPGGIGKSTLIAKFLIDHLHESQPVPFTYVDFERPTSSVREPVSLVAEAATQLAMQFPAFRTGLEALVEECHLVARRQRQEQSEVDELQQVATTRVSRGRTALHAAHARSVDEERRLAGRLGELVASIVSESAGETPGDPRPERPFLMVLDSFEEAQYRDSPVLDRMWAMLDALQESYPWTRVVVAGRAPVGHPATPADGLPTISLNELDHEAAVGFLVAAGVTDPELAEAVAGRIGGNPLSLKLAARIAVRQAGRSSAWVREIPAKRRWLIRSVDDMLIQGMLYERILQHITDDDVRRLAHPGLVLRRITADIIEKVLAPHCGIKVRDSAHADRLFAAVARQLDLVEETQPGVLEHRSDVRRIMLRLAAADRAAAVERVGRSAVAYYAKSNEAADRAEEIYHRLLLGESPRSVERRWLPGVERYLFGAADELPPRAASFLAARLHSEASNDSLAGADQEDWETVTAREVENLLQQGYVTQALARLRQRRERTPGEWTRREWTPRDWTPCSPLHALLAEALIRKDEIPEARHVVSAALDNPGAATCGESYLELLLLSARLAELAGDLRSADAELLNAERVATSLDRDLEALGALLERARIHRLERDDDLHDADAALARRVRQVPAQVLVNTPTLLRAVAAEVGESEPSLLAYTLDLVGLPTRTKETVRMLAEAIRRAADSQPRLVQILNSVLASPADIHPLSAPGRLLQFLSEAQRRGRLDQVAKELLAVRDDTGALRSGIAAAMTAGTANSGRELDRPARDWLARDWPARDRPDQDRLDQDRLDQDRLDQDRLDQDLPG